ncbi:MAG: hypothetical protein NTX13_15050, partial [Acidobacteria bacterium]|nr:hypothetical protein [Acidobacteriota bacterium]
MTMVEQQNQWRSIPQKPPGQPALKESKASLIPPDDPVAWARQALGFHPDPKQESILRSNALRLILLSARQVGKSTIAA